MGSCQSDNKISNVSEPSQEHANAERTKGQAKESSKEPNQKSLHTDVKNNENHEIKESETAATKENKVTVENDKNTMQTESIQDQSKDVSPRRKPENGRSGRL